MEGPLRLREPFLKQIVHNNILDKQFPESYNWDEDFTMFSEYFTVDELENFKGGIFASI